MRNLRNIKHTAIAFSEDATLLTATAWDPSDDSLVCAFGPSENDALVSLKRFGKTAYSSEQAQAIASWDAPSPIPEIPVDRILDLHCFSDSKTIVLVLAGGDLIVVREEPEPGQDLIEIVGSVDAGIAAAAWSPDEELLAIATRANTMLFMTRDFENTANVTLSTEDVKVSDHVSVGWGKKETQFKGRGVKALRDPTMPEHVDEGLLRDGDDGGVSVTWRGDGQYVAMNGILDTEPKRRIIRVYSREGVLESVSEPINYLGSALSWKPSGQLIATTQHLADRTDVVFFERNGLRHGEFSLGIEPENLRKSATTIALSWNIDSTVLAVTLPDRVQLWTTSNYHWYLKQEIIFGLVEEVAKAVGASWHPEKPLHLGYFSATELRSLDYTFDAALGPLNPPHDTGLVAVIDGKKLKVTPLRTANVPPPMAFDEIDLPSAAKDVAFSQTGNRLAVLHEFEVSLWQCDYSLRPAKRAKLMKQCRIAESGEKKLLPQQVVMPSEGEAIALCSIPNEEASQLLHVALETGETTVTSAGASLSSIYMRSDHDRIIFAGDDGTILQAKNKGAAALDLSPSELMLPVACPKVAIWHGLEQDIAVGLTASGVLHVQSDYKPIRIPGCTSFVLAPSHLIYTTSQHLLKFVHLHDGELEIPPDEPEKDERCRNVERGAKLVTVMPSAYSLVLQMPRGNLETINPRALVLAGIRTSINNRDYKKAFLICRTHRVDMNILHDYAPEQFMRDVELFVKQVRRTEYIDLVLSSLSEENVAETLYKETLRSTLGIEAHVNGVDAPVQPPPAAASKISAICDAFISVLEKDRARHLQSIVTAHVCKNPPDLEAGLQLVSELRKQGNEEQLDQAVEHICFLADVNQLYDTALGLYDLDVALLVAQQSQKDPREYLPYLQSLHDMQPLRRQFAIDNDLRRHRKALTHLHELDVFDELKDYMTKHELHSTAMELYRYDKTRMHQLMVLYAGYLSSRNRYQDAGIAYEFVQDYTNAYEAYRSASMWQESLACAALVPISQDQLTSLAQNLADGLEEAKNFAEAAMIYDDYLHDPTQSLKLLCKAYKFPDAIRKATQRQKEIPNLIPEVIDPGLIEASATMTELLADMKTQLNAQVPRLRELRVKKAEDPMGFLDGADGGDGVDIPDNLSLAPTDATTSAGTFMTRYTNRSTGTLATNATRKTSKNRRREERKRAKGKKGTVYEEEYLVNSIARLVERLNVVGDDVSALVQGLMRRAMRERAVAVEAAMVEVVQYSRGCLAEVFAAQTDAAAVAGGDAAEKPVGGEGVLWEAITGAGRRSEPPVLKEFQRLSLLSS